MNSTTRRIYTAALAAVIAISATAALAAAPAAEQKSVISVLERFKNYSGPREPSSLAALFTAPATAKVIQKPELVLSDGSSTIKITLDASLSGETAPSFAVIGGALISSKHDTTGAWLLEVLPEAGTLNCTLMVLTAQGSTEYPLTTAPPLSAEMDLSPQGFADFLGGQSGSSLPVLDLNADGKLNYLDDYIFTANFLARKMANRHDPSTRNQRARELTPQRLPIPVPAAK
jgi:hypothetical protein